MIDHPKVSERMEALLLEVVLAARVHERNGDRYTLADYEESRAALLSAIAEIEQRAEKWKEAAVALYQCSRELADIGCKDFALTNNRLDAAIAALGDEWDEAVR